MEEHDINCKLSIAEFNMVFDYRKEKLAMENEAKVYRQNGDAETTTSISSTEQAVRDIQRLREYLKNNDLSNNDPVTNIIFYHKAQYSRLGDLLKNISLSEAVNVLIEQAHQASVDGGWWNDPITDEDLRGKRNVPELLMLIVSEISEAMEGYRKDLMDDKLPHHKMITVELADGLLRIGDLAGSMSLPVGKATEEKRNFNLTREDHKKEQRLKAGGKKF